MKKLLLVVLLLSGCAASYVIPDGKQEAFEKDRLECYEVKPSTASFIIAGKLGESIDHENKIRECMTTRGWNIKE